jgi:hypothetical protein
MTASPRENQLFDVFATLADTLVAGYDVVELLQLLVDTCQGALDVAEAGLLLANDGGDLELVASTSESLDLVETIQLSAEQGPCIACFRTGRPVSVPDLDGEGPRPGTASRAPRSSRASAPSTPCRCGSAPR